MGFHVGSFLHGESFPAINVATAQGEAGEEGEEAGKPCKGALSSEEPAQVPTEEWTWSGCI